jgi:hypothetical protein
MSVGLDELRSSGSTVESAAKFFAGVPPAAFRHQQAPARLILADPSFPIYPPSARFHTAKPPPARADWAA